MNSASGDVFWTGFITRGHEGDQPPLPVVGAGWTAELAPQRRRPFTVEDGGEIVIRASSWIMAQRALDLIQSSHLLFNGEAPCFDSHPIAHNADEPAWMDVNRRNELFEYCYCAANFPLACAIAAWISRRRKWVYAVTKYQFSLSLCSVHCVDLEPWRSPHLAVSVFPEDHVKFAHAIISAYSVIEDLGLNVRASTKNGSRLNNGDWNPPVKQSLERRLIGSGVNLSETVLWTVRGTKRRTESRRPLPDGTKAPWSAGTVRDTEIPVVDAIAYAAWFRSCVAAHGVHNETRSLSPYDVINVQFIARRLLLETLGFWRWPEQKARNRSSLLHGHQ